jgi:NAD-dependent deacetylase
MALPAFSISSTFMVRAAEMSMPGQRREINFEYERTIMKTGKIDEPNFIQKLRPDTRIVVLTGAGISAESGIPTFRDAQEGLWSRFRPEELASPEGFLKNPKLVFDWYAWRRRKVLEARPNRGHEILALWEERFPQLSLITQNVDGLHQKAGSHRLVEMHGSLHRLICFERRHPATWMEEYESVPRCSVCGSLMRPDVVWFGEMLDSQVMQDISRVLTRCEVFLAIGTSGLVYPAAGFLEEARRHGALTVVINKEPAGADRCDLFLQGSASEILERLQNARSDPRGSRAPGES